MILVEVHDEGSHNMGRSLVWVNSYLVQSADAESAYKKAVEIGVGQQDEPGSHTCNGQKAHWEFRGLEELIPISDRPADNALLWCDESARTSEVKSLPKKLELTVFAWEEQRRSRWPNADSSE